MFEGKLPSQRLSPDPADASAGEGNLRGMTWRDLRTRLEAARDLRESLQAVGDEHLASFDAHSARRIAALGEGKQAVNPDGLANGKGNGCMNGASQGAGFGSGPGN